MELIRRFWDAVIALSPEARDHDEVVRFRLCAPQRIEEACRNAGRAYNDVALIDVDTRFRDFGDYWSPFLGSHGPALVFALSLGEISRERLRERIRDRRPIRSDGSIHLIARA